MPKQKNPNPDKVKLAAAFTIQHNLQNELSESRATADALNKRCEELGDALSRECSLRHDAEKKYLQLLNSEKDLESLLEQSKADLQHWYDSFYDTSKWGQKLEEKVLALTRANEELRVSLEKALEDVQLYKIRYETAERFQAFWYEKAREATAPGLFRRFLSRLVFWA